MRSGLISIAVVAGLSSLGGCWRDHAAPVEAAKPVDPAASSLPHVLAGEFGMIDDFNKFTKATVIPLRPGVGYGWRVRVPCRKPQMVDFREVLKMPAPGEWHVDQRTRISNDRTTITTKDTAGCDEDGWITHRWYASLHDPDGVYVVTVEIEGYTPVRFHPRFARP